MAVMCGAQFVDPPIAEEGPMRSAELDFFQIALGDQDGLFVTWRFFYNLPIGSGDERLAPEFDAIIVHGFSGSVENLFQADAVG